MSEVNSKILELQNNKFGALHNFHTERTASIINELADRFGEAVIHVVEQMEIDKKGLISWHLKRTAELVEKLQESFGPEVVDIIKLKEGEDRRKNGLEMAQSTGGNTIADIIPYFGGEQNVIDRSSDSVLIQTQFCPLADSAREMGIENLIYSLHCCSDHFFVEGFNPELGCEVQKSMLNGDNFCEHYIYKK